MWRITVTMGLALVLMTEVSACAQSQDRRFTESAIPLKSIWAYNMPGTRDVRELEAKPELTATIDELARHSDVWKILKALNRRPKEGTKAGPALVVAGTGREALKNAAAAIVDNDKKRPVTVPPNSEVSIVFYSHNCGRYVRLVEVDQSPNLVTVKYQFVSHPQQIVTSHFAIIPLGKLRHGDVQVKVKQLPPIDDRGQPTGQLPNPLRVVSDSFTFTVQKR